MVASPSLILHLGAHKTGTSLLQKYMRDRSAELARMHIVAISRSDTNHLIGWGGAPRNHPELLREAVLAASRPSPIRGRRSRLLRLVPGFGRVRPRTVVVSHENALGRPFLPDEARLYPSALRCARGLASSLAGMEPRVVYYIRSQEEFLESYYLQTVHQGGTQTFREWLAAIDVTALSWVPIVEGLARTFGAERVEVCDFATIRQGQNQFVEEFLRICDPTLNPTVDYHPRRNISVSQQGLDLALAMNPLLTSGAERHTVRSFLQKNFNNDTGARPVLLDEQEKATLRERYAAENADLLERFAPAARRP